MRNVQSSIKKWLINLFLLILLAIGVFVLLRFPFCLVQYMEKDNIDTVPGSADGWLSFFGSYVGGTGGAIVAGFIAYYVARIQIKEQAKLEDKRQREFLVLEVRIEKYQELISNIWNINHILGRMRILISTHVVSPDEKERRQFESEVYENLRKLSDESNRIRVLLKLTQLPEYLIENVNNIDRKIRTYFEHSVNGVSVESYDIIEQLKEDINNNYFSVIDVRERAIEQLSELLDKLESKEK